MFMSVPAAVKGYGDEQGMICNLKVFELFSEKHATCYYNAL